MSRIDAATGHSLIGTWVAVSEQRHRRCGGCGLWAGPERLSREPISRNNWCGDGPSFVENVTKCSLFVSVYSQQRFPLTLAILSVIAYKANQPKRTHRWPTRLSHSSGSRHWRLGGVTGTATATPAGKHNSVVLRGWQPRQPSRRAEQSRAAAAFLHLYPRIVRLRRVRELPGQASRDVRSDAGHVRAARQVSTNPTSGRPEESPFFFSQF